MRNAHGARAAALKPSLAAADGEMEKLTRYGSTVSPLSFETYGRLGQKSQTLLCSIAHLVASSTGRAGGKAGNAVYADWRLELERVLVKEIADITLLCLGHTSGLRTARANGRRRVQPIVTAAGGRG